MKKFTVTLLFVCLIGSLVAICHASGLQDSYNEAIGLMTQGRFSEAAQAFDNLFGYEDSNQMAAYAKALNAGENGDYELANITLTALGDFRDCPSQIRYYQARQYESWDNFWSWDQAMQIYGELGFFRDSCERIEAIKELKMDRYDDTLILGKEGAYEEAVSAFGSMNGYAQSNEYYSYYLACMNEQNGEYDYALHDLAVLRGLGDFEACSKHYASYAEDYIDSVQVGDRVSFGYQDWYVLDVDRASKKMMLITAEVVDYKTYLKGSWENTDAREWLNDPYSGFLSRQYFDVFDTDLLEDTLVSVNHFTAKQPPAYSETYGYVILPPKDFTIDGVDMEYTGIDVYDKAFLLSVEEVEKYLKGTEMVTGGIDYWLRDTGSYIHAPGSTFQSAFYVESNGDVGYVSISYGDRYVRPAVMVSLA